MQHSLTENYAAPSWSWAAWDGPVSFFLNIEHACVKSRIGLPIFHAAHTDQSRALEAPFGVLELSAHVKPGTRSSTPRAGLMDRNRSGFSLGPNIHYPQHWLCNNYYSMSDESQGGASDVLFFDGQETLPASFHCLILQTAIRFDATQVFPRPSEPI